MNPLNFHSLLSNTLRVAQSKGQGHARLYLDKEGQVQSDRALAATIEDLFFLMRQHYTEAERDLKKWNLFKLNIVTIVGEERSNKELNLFMKLVAVSGVRLHDDPHHAQLDTLLSINNYVTEQCVQDLCMTIFKEVKILERAIFQSHVALASSAVSQFFLSTNRRVKIRALQVLHDAKPLSPVAEVLCSKLHVIDKADQIVKIPFDEVVSNVTSTFSAKKIAMFVKESFIAELSARHPEIATEIQDVHQFCKKLYHFTNLFFLYSQHSKVSSVFGNFLKNYNPLVLVLMKEASDLGLSAADRYEAALATDLKLPYSIKVLRTILEKNEINEALFLLDPTRSDKFYYPETDLLPFEAILQEYDTEYNDFFLDALDKLYRITTIEKRSILTKEHTEEASESAKEHSYFPKNYVEFISKLGGPAFPGFLPRKDSWLLYRRAWIQYLRDATDSPHVAFSEKELARFARDVAGTFHKEEAVVPAPQSAGGGAAASAQAADDEIHIAEAEDTFAEEKAGEIINLHEEIGKKTFEFTYANRVIDWFRKPKKMLKERGLDQKPAVIQEKVVILHTFSSVVDEFIHSDYSFITDWDNEKRHKKDLLIRIPGLMTFKGQTHRGIFEYCIDQSKMICYHRCFKDLKDTDRLGDFVNQPSLEFDVHFPALDLVAEALEPQKLTGPSKKIDFVRDFLGTIQFYDPDTEMAVTLYKLGK